MNLTTLKWGANVQSELFSIHREYISLREKFFELAGAADDLIGDDDVLLVDIVPDGFDISFASVKLEFRLVACRDTQGELAGRIIVHRTNPALPHSRDVLGSFLVASSGITDFNDGSVRLDDYQQEIIAHYLFLAFETQPPYLRNPVVEEG